MSRKTEFRYFTFPITLLENATENLKTACYRAVDYAIYSHACKLELGTILQKEQSAAKYLNVALGKNDGTSYKRGLEIEKATLPQTPKVSLKADLVFEFAQNDKTEFEVVVFLAFSALRSILGGKAYIKTNNAMLLARMAGQPKPGKDLPPELEKYANRYQLEKIKNELRIYWKLQVYGRHTQGFYFSFQMDIKELVMAAEEKRYTYKLKQISQAQNEAVTLAKNKLYGK